MKPACARLLLRLVAVSLAGTVLLGGERRSEAIEDLVSPRSLAVGNALRADATGAIGPQLNPGAMPFRRGYNIEVLYGLRVQDLGHHLNLAIVDSVTTKVAAGVYYSYVHSDPKFSTGNFGNPVPTDPTSPAPVREGHETGLSLALPIGELFALGVTAKYITVETAQKNSLYRMDGSGVGPEKIFFDTSADSSRGSVANGFTFDVGLALRLAQGKFNIGLVGYNLIPLKSVEAPISMGFGLAYKPTNLLTIALDTVVYFDGRLNKVVLPTSTMDVPTGRWNTDNVISARLGGGLEWLIVGKVPLRLGAMWDSGRPGTYVSLGTGYQHTKFSIDLSYRQQVQGGIESYLVLGIRVFLE